VIYLFIFRHAFSDFQSSFSRIQFSGSRIKLFIRAKVTALPKRAFHGRLAPPRAAKAAVPVSSSMLDVVRTSQRDLDPDLRALRSQHWAVGLESSVERVTSGRLNVSKRRSHFDRARGRCCRGRTRNCTPRLDRCTVAQVGNGGCLVERGSLAALRAAPGLRPCGDVAPASLPLCRCGLTPAKH
jgi:hypothetical protein